MTDIRFYHLQNQKLEQALSDILDKALTREHRIVVKVGNAERLEWLNTALWTQQPENFLPHGSAKEGHAAEQPIWLTTEDENPNSANVLVLTDGAISAMADKFDICCDMFDGNDGVAVEAARGRWKAHKEKIEQGAKHALTYFKSTEF